MSVSVMVFSTEMSDGELVIFFQARGHKDDRPFQELFKRYQNLIWGLCYKFTNNPQDAEDLMQDVFIKIHRNLPRFESRSSFKTWAYRIGLNTCYNEVRRLQRRPQEAGAELDTLTQWMPATNSTERDVEVRSRQSLLQTAMSTLRPEDSRILMMKDIEERPYAEIAQTLSIGISAAKMRAKRARQALKVSYMQLSGEEGLAAAF
ncbi:MAG: sigma-70 family RNA polymerase sigma factor [Chloroflexi bacterium]|nr:sigma-70 family RNA polymerase sigma factor [Chloroflexota bacterium]